MPGTPSPDHIAQWRQDEQAPFSGWDFSYLQDRWFQNNPPWDYKIMAKGLLQNAQAVLDIGTGGGEILASLAPLPKHTIAIEAFKPNIAVASKRLSPLGVTVIGIDDYKSLPLPNNTFDLVLNRQSALKAAEIFRIMRKNGIFLTQQVGSDNLNDLSRAFDTEPPYQNWLLSDAQRQLTEAGFSINQAKQWQGKLEFNDVGAIVYFLKAIPWIVPNFNVHNNIAHLKRLQADLDDGKKLVFQQSRFLILAQK